MELHVGAVAREIFRLQLGRRRWATDGPTRSPKPVALLNRFNWAVAVGPRMAARQARSLPCRQDSFNWAVAVGPRMVSMLLLIGPELGWLQLGRRRWATDGPLEVRALLPQPPRFNWAVAVGPRMAISNQEPKRLERQASIGPSPLGHGWFRGEPSMMSWRLGFNWAVAVGPRMADGSAESNLSESPALQLGRRRWATDGGHWCRPKLDCISLQLGRRRWATDGARL